jgi:tetratricopeptide (TPR) repeat protein
MRKYILVAGLLVCAFSNLKSQELRTDSLWQSFETATNDSLKLTTITRLYARYVGLGMDSNAWFSKKILVVCEKLNIPRYNALGQLYSSYIFIRTGQYQKAQDLISKASLIAEETSDNEVRSRVENFRNLIESDPNKQLIHLRKAIEYKRSIGHADQYYTILLGNISSTFQSAKQPDSAFFYAQKMYEMSISLHDTTSIFVTGIMGNAYLNIGQPDIAYAFFKKGIALTKNQPVNSLMGAYISMAGYFEKMNNLDSAIFFWKMPFEHTPRDGLRTKLRASQKIYAYYLAKENNDSAVKYMNIYIVLNDSVNNTNKLAQLEATKFDEELKQKDLAVEKNEERKERKHNIQLVITAMAILAAIIVFLLLSRSIMVHHKTVELFSVIFLLVIFEFINLLTHPFLERITNHTPFLMLLGLVLIAAIIVPLHHKLQHWTTHKLVEKNKAIRLAKAKKTIDELE